MDEQEILERISLLEQEILDNEEEVRFAANEIDDLEEKLSELRNE